jgi:hypothetical protein
MVGSKRRTTLINKTKQFKITGFSKSEKKSVAMAIFGQYLIINPGSGFSL